MHMLKSSSAPILQILSWYHPSALERFSTSNSLSEVCADPLLRDPKSALVKYSITPGVPFQPLLSEKWAWTGEQAAPLTVQWPLGFSD